MNKTVRVSTMLSVLALCILLTATAAWGQAPTVQAHDITFSSVGYLSMTVSWTNGDGVRRLVVASEGSPVVSFPVDGASYTANSAFGSGSNLGSNNFVVYDGSGTVHSVHVTNLLPTTMYHFRVFEYNGLGISSIFQTSTANLNPNNRATIPTSAASDVVAVASSEAVTISSLINDPPPLTSATGVQAWQVTIRDGGGAPDADPLPTIVTDVTLTPGGSNTVNWLQGILAADLFDGATHLASATVNATSLVFSGSPLIEVQDNGSKTLSLRVSLKNTGLTDNQIFQFVISDGNVITESDVTSSQMIGLSPINSDGTKNRIEVIATGLVFTAQPPTAVVPATDFSAAVAARDVNNNTDVDYTANFILSRATGTGVLTSVIGLNRTPVSGVILWNDLRYDTPESGVSIQAVSGTLFLATSNTFIVTASGYVVSVSIVPGWNMISLPVTNAVPGNSVHDVYPTIPASGYPPDYHVYRFDQILGFTSETMLLNGTGYWGRFPAGITQSIIGTDLSTLVVNVLAGWNLIGSISHPAGVPSIGGVVASSFFGYSGGYVIPTSIAPGRAYYMKAAYNGSFTLTYPGPGRTASVSSGLGALDALNTLTITDSKGGLQKLYFGADVNKDIPALMYAMPPVPPVGAFDARFETAEGGSMVQTHGKESAEFTVAIHSDAYPVTVSWHVKDAMYELTAGSGIMQTIRGEGTMKISDSEVNRLFLKLTGAGELPREYALAQNYPNPFNPTTNIKFAVPELGNVKIAIYDMLGQEVRTLVSEQMDRGTRIVEWNGRDNNGAQVTSGMYIYRMTSGSFVQSHKMMLLK